MRRDLTLILLASVITVTAATTAPFNSVSAEQATSLRGGDAAWCTTPIVLKSCDDCFVFAGAASKCVNTSGALFRCVAATNSICQQCHLGDETDCPGVKAYWDGIKFCPDNVVPDREDEDCGETRHAGALSYLNPGTCPTNCPGNDM